MRRTMTWLLTALFTVTVALPAFAQGDGDLADRYGETAGRILDTALTDAEGWDKLTYLTTVIGHRLSGSPQLEQTIEWAHARMLEEGLANVRKQPVMVPHWVRGRERAEILAPVPRTLPILGLGRSVGTSEEGISAPVLVVGSFEELEALGPEAVAGKIVVYAVPWKGYGQTVRYRISGASRAGCRGCSGLS